MRQFSECFITLIFLIANTMALRPQEEVPMLSAMNDIRFAASLRTAEKDDPMKQAEGLVKAAIKETKTAANVAVQQTEDVRSHAADKADVPKGVEPPADKKSKMQQVVEAKKATATQEVAEASLEEGKEKVAAAEAESQSAKKEGESKEGVQDAVEAVIKNEEGKTLEKKSEEASTEAKSEAKTAEEHH